MLLPNDSERVQHCLLTTGCVLRRAPCVRCAGKRALGFVLGNQGMIDKTLLFDIELIALR